MRERGQLAGLVRVRVRVRGRVRARVRVRAELGTWSGELGTLHEGMQKAHVPPQSTPVSPPG